MFGVEFAPGADKAVASTTAVIGNDQAWSNV